jgi:hypothetical protein
VVLLPRAHDQDPAPLETPAAGSLAPRLGSLDLR